MEIKLFMGIGITNLKFKITTALLLGNIISSQVFGMPSDNDTTDTEDSKIPIHVVIDENTPTAKRNWNPLFIEHLPFDAIYHILSFLDINSRIQLMMTSRQMMIEVLRSFNYDIPKMCDEFLNKYKSLSEVIESDHVMIYLDNVVRMHFVNDNYDNPYMQFFENCKNLKSEFKKIDLTQKPIAVLQTLTPQLQNLYMMESFLSGCGSVNGLDFYILTIKSNDIFKSMDPKKQNLVIRYMNSLFEENESFYDFKTLIISELKSVKNQDLESIKNQHHSLISLYANFVEKFIPNKLRFSGNRRYISLHHWMSWCSDLKHHQNLDTISKLFSDLEKIDNKFISSSQGELSVYDDYRMRIPINFYIMGAGYIEDLAKYADQIFYGSYECNKCIMNGLTAFTHFQKKEMLEKLALDMQSLSPEKFDENPKKWNENFISYLHQNKWFDRNKGLE